MSASKYEWITSRNYFGHIGNSISTVLECFYPEITTYGNVTRVCSNMAIFLQWHSLALDFYFLWDLKKSYKHDCSTSESNQYYYMLQEPS